MPRIQSAGSTRKISLSQIVESGNVRANYSDIEELAQSIKVSGLIQPIAVHPLGKNEDDIEQYELIAGHRRARAFKYLFEGGDSGFSMIDAVVVLGDKLTIQLAENLQRSDLTAREREQGIFQMTRDGRASQRDISLLLGKSESYVSNNLRAYNTRRIADKESIDTSHISTVALCEIATAAGNDIPELLKRLSDEGGSVQAARKIGREYRAEVDHGETEYAEADSFEDVEIEPEQEVGVKTQAVPKFSWGEPNDIERATPRERPTQERDPIEFDPPHREVDINDVLIIIKDYINAADTRFPPSEAQSKKDAAWDILALLHERLK